MNSTTIIGQLFKKRQRQIESYTTHAEEIQERVLKYLITQAAQTEWGKTYGYKDITTYSTFHSHIPVSNYDDLKEYIDRMRHGQADLSLIHISEPTRRPILSRMPSSA